MWHGNGSVGAVFSFVTYATITAILLGIFGLARMQSQNIKAAFLVSALAVVLASVSFGPRTLLFGWLYLIAELAILYSFRNARDFLWVLPPLFLLWVNTHGSWLIGLVLLVLFALSGCVEGRWGSIEAKCWSMSQKLRLGGSCSRFGVRNFSESIWVAPGGLSIQSSISSETKYRECRRMEKPGLPFAARKNRAGDSAGRHRSATAPTKKVDAARGVFPGCRNIRRPYLFALFILNRHSGPSSPGRGIYGNGCPPYYAERDKPWLNGPIMLACIVAICLKFPNNRQLLRAESSQFPDHAQTFLEHFHPEGKVLNDYLWGGYLIWNDRQIPVFVDSRVDVFEYNGIFKDYLDLTQFRNSLSILDKYAIRYVLFEKKAPLSYLLEHTPGWKIDYQDDTTILFERSGRAHR